MSMHSIRYRGCLAQQDNKTLEVHVRKLGACPEHIFKCDKKLSAKELRAYVVKYLIEYAEDPRNEKYRASLQS